MSVLGGYHLANRRNIGHSGAAAAAQMITCDNLHGNFTAGRIVIDYEHRIALAKHLRCSRFHLENASGAADAAELAQPLQPLPPCPGPIDFIDVHEYKGDGTNQDAIEKHKVHVSIVNSSYCDVRAAVAAAEDGRQMQKQAEQSSNINCTVCDLQIVHTGTGEETYALMQAELRFVGCPSWTSRCDAACSNPRRVSVYCMGLDNGPDNQGATKRILASIKDVPRVVLILTWCFVFTKVIWDLRMC